MKKIIKEYCQWDDNFEMKHLSHFFTWQILINSHKVYVAESLEDCAKCLKEIVDDPNKEIVMNYAAILKLELYNWSITNEEIVS